MSPCPPRCCDSEPPICKRCPESAFFDADINGFPEYSGKFVQLDEEFDDVTCDWSMITGLWWVLDGTGLGLQFGQPAGIVKCNVPHSKGRAETFVQFRFTFATFTTAAYVFPSFASEDYNFFARVVMNTDDNKSCLELGRTLAGERQVFASRILPSLGPDDSMQYRVFFDAAHKLFGVAEGTITNDWLVAKIPDGDPGIAPYVALGIDGGPGSGFTDLSVTELLHAGENDPQCVYPNLHCWITGADPQMLARYDDHDEVEQCDIHVVSGEVKYLTGPGGVNGSLCFTEAGFVRLTSPYRNSTLNAIIGAIPEFGKFVDDPDEDAEFEPLIFTDPAGASFYVAWWVNATGTHRNTYAKLTYLGEFRDTVFDGTVQFFLAELYISGQKVQEAFTSGSFLQLCIGKGDGNTSGGGVMAHKLGALPMTLFRHPYTLPKIDERTYIGVGASGLTSGQAISLMDYNQARYNQPFLPTAENGPLLPTSAPTRFVRNSSTCPDSCHDDIECPSLMEITVEGIDAVISTRMRGATVAGFDGTHLVERVMGARIWRKWIRLSVTPGPGYTAYTAPYLFSLLTIIFHDDGSYEYSFTGFDPENDPGNDGIPLIYTCGAATTATSFTCEDSLEGIEFDDFDHFPGDNECDLSGVTVGVTPILTKCGEYPLPVSAIVNLGGIDVPVNPEDQCDDFEESCLDVAANSPYLLPLISSTGSTLIFEAPLPVAIGCVGTESSPRALRLTLKSGGSICSFLPSEWDYCFDWGAMVDIVMSDGQIIRAWAKPWDIFKEINCGSGFAFNDNVISIPFVGEAAFYDDGLGLGGTLTKCNFEFSSALVGFNFP